ncbi:DUF924 family protein [Hoeflea ulvae]|uniref:DUF924 domain-containing protein n=1 Tax=Hoeflea ulvae TaxID=2983764 RepID=A0ABT3YJ58_9HYPH|nr:DUF924 family protein [Hoeflea ulvae]MCY0095936.1 DUF924 domain-containing protein [Hoeflea ulvae]
MTETPESVLKFWFEELTSKDWFVKSDEIDRLITERFAELHLAQSREATPEWRATPEARLARIIVLDQFPRNIYRGSPLAFATDRLALNAAKAAIAVGADAATPENRRIFFYMPFEHAESLEEQARAVALCEALGNETYLDYAIKHQDVIKRFGRFPHRNPILGRTSTAEEEAYLAEPGAGF